MVLFSPLARILSLYLAVADPSRSPFRQWMAQTQFAPQKTGGTVRGIHSLQRRNLACYNRGRDLAVWERLLPELDMGNDHGRRS